MQAGEIHGGGEKVQNTFSISETESESEDEAKFNVCFFIKKK